MVTGATHYQVHPDGTRTEVERDEDEETVTVRRVHKVQVRRG